VGGSSKSKSLYDATDHKIRFYQLLDLETKRKGEGEAVFWKICLPTQNPKLFLTIPNFNSAVPTPTNVLYFMETRTGEKQTYVERGRDVRASTYRTTGTVPYSRGRVSSHLCGECNRAKKEISPSSVSIC
jgi:hypothetical protein